MADPTAAQIALMSSALLAPRMAVILTLWPDPDITFPEMRRALLGDYRFADGREHAAFNRRCRIALEAIVESRLANVELTYVGKQNCIRITRLKSPTT